MFFTLLGSAGVLNGNFIEDTQFFKILNYIFSNILIGMVVVFLIYIIFIKQKKDGFINSEVQLGIKPILSFLIRMFCTYTYLLVLLTINLFLYYLFYWSKGNTYSQINKSLFIDTGLFFYFSSFIIFSVVLLFSTVFNSTAGLVINMTLIIFFSLSINISYAINLFTNKTVNNIKMKNKTLFEYQLTTGQDFYSTFNKSEIYSNLFDPSKVKTFFESSNIQKELTGFNYEYNEKLNKININPESATFEEELKNALYSRALNTGQLNFVIDNDHLFNNDYIFTKIINDIYTVFLESEIPKNNQGLGYDEESQYGWFLFENNSNLKYKNVDLLETINILKKNKVTEQYSELLDYIYSSYVNLTYILNNENITYNKKGIFRGKNIEKRINSKKYDPLSYLWPYLFEINSNPLEDDKYLAENQEVLKTYYNYPELMIINYLFFHLWRNSMYIDMELNLSELFPSVNSSDNENRKEIFLGKYLELNDDINKASKSNFLNYYTYIYYSNNQNLINDYINSKSEMAKLYPYNCMKLDKSIFEEVPFKNFNNKLYKNFNAAFVYLTHIMIFLCLLGITAYIFKFKIII
ncbi:hypothetical protein [Spiroplasma diminutum]|uniref:hypothetical protein n=1 Tax=Spiroplasma diminutum TaxID=216936 RepID=UPI0011D20A8E|nr:hypothetical protein [Spiroplasma diminutum]